MNRKTLTIACDRATAQSMAEAVRAYVQAAYPEGGSECTQVARATLLDTASLCEAHAGDGLTLRRRQLPMIRAALRWYFGEQESGGVDLLPRLESLLASGTKGSRSG